MEKLKDHDKKISKHDDIITHILVSMGKMQVKTAMITGIFSTIGGGLSIIILKFVFNAF